MTHENFSNVPIDPTLPRPQIGEEVTVIGERVFSNGIDCYLLAEYTAPLPHIWGYDKRNFAPLNGPDETTLVNEEWEEKVCVPVNSEPCV